MPRIPKLETSISFSGDRLPTLRSVPNEAIIPEAIAGLTGDLANTFAKLHEQDVVNKTIDEVNKFKTTMQSEIIDYMNTTGENSYDGQKRLVDFVNKYKTDEVSKIKDSKVKERVLNTIDNYTINLMPDYANHETKQRKTVSENVRIQALDNITTNAFFRPSSLEESIKDWNDVITAQVQTGQISEQEAVNIGTIGRQKIAEKSLSGLLTTNPDVALNIINSGTYDKYLSPDMIIHYRNVATKEQENRLKIMEAEKKEQARQNIENANKEITDAMLEGNPEKYRQILGKYRDVITDTDYTRWAKEYNNLIENLSKPVKSVEGNQLLLNLEIQALTGKGLETKEKLEDYKNQVANAVKDRIISSNDAKRLIKDAEQFSGNVFMQKEIEKSIDTIDFMFKNGYLGDKKSKEAALNREKIIRDIYKYAKQNPEKDVTGFVEKIIEPLTLNKWFIDFRTRGLKKSEAIRKELLSTNTGESKDMTNPKNWMADDYLRIKGLK